MSSTVRTTQRKHLFIKCTSSSHCSFRRAEAATADSLPMSGGRTDQKLPLSERFPGGFDIDLITRNPIESVPAHFGRDVILCKNFFRLGWQSKSGTESHAFILSQRKVKHLKKIKIQRATLCKSLKIFALSVGTAAVLMLGYVGIWPPEDRWVEASAFNRAGQAQAAPAAAEAESSSLYHVIPLGTAFGIKLFSDGVIVASLSEVYTASGPVCPAKDSGIRPGDYLLEANGQELLHNADVARIIGQSAGDPVVLTLRREEKTFQATVTPVVSEGSFKTGMWIRDSAAGIGTLTFCDPETGAFAGLGHGICDMDAGGVISLKSGEPAPITLCGIIKGQRDEPGQLRGYFSSEEALGTLSANNETGVYGQLWEIPAGEALEVLSRDKVHEGAAQLMVTLDDSGPAFYEAEIEEIGRRDEQTRNLVVRVTDPVLLERTGGIVQGMSGCPILQDGKLAGAVTHVFTKDPTRGYGIFAETMCRECTISSMSK